MKGLIPFLIHEEWPDYYIWLSVNRAFLLTHLIEDNILEKVYLIIIFEEGLFNTL